MIEINKNYNESNLETMAKMPDCFVDLVVTSPPYDGLRTYNGYSFPFENIAKELYRVTKHGGILVWVIGDETKNFCESMTSFKQAIYLKELGFNLLDTMIYYKQNYAPAYPTLKRYANQFEYMFVFSKGKPKTFNPIQKERVRNKQERVGFRQKNGDWIKKEVGLKKKTKDASNVWGYGGWDKNLGHPAVFPLQLAIDHILTWTNENDLVYDCFNGSGTTSEASIKTNRNWIGSEISSEYCNIIEERIKKAWEEKRKEKDLQTGTLFENEM